MAKSEYYVKDIGLSESGRRRIEETAQDMKGLMEIIKQHGHKKPLRNLNISGCVTVTYETANFIRVLKELGANLRWSSDNRISTKDDAAAAIASEGIPVFAKSDETIEEYESCLEKCLEFRNENDELVGPDYIIDDGCDLTEFAYLKKYELLKNLKGICEQTTIGITKLNKIKKNKKLSVPAMDVNNSPIKLKFDNEYGSRESLIKGIQRSINTQIAGKNVVVCGYGNVGKGCAASIDSVGGKVIVVEANPIRIVEAEMNGYQTMSLSDACKVGDLFITATGCENAIGKKYIKKIKSGAVLCNMGHGNAEFDVSYLENDTKIRKKTLNEYLDVYTFPDGKEISVLCQGYLVNLKAGGGHPPKSMSVTFTNHILGLLDMVEHPEKYTKHDIYGFPKELDAACILLNFPEIAKKAVKLTKEQKRYLGNG